MWGQPPSAVRRVEDPAFSVRRKLQKAVELGSTWTAEGGVPTSASSGLPDVDLFVDELLVGLIGSRQLKRIRDHSLTLFHTDDQVGAADPVGLGEIGRGPAGRMVGMGMVEADDVFAALSALTLDADQLARVNVVAVLQGVGAGIAAAGGRGHNACTAVVHAAQQHATALMRVGFFAVPSDFSVVSSCDLQHEKPIHPETLRHRELVFKPKEVFRLRLLNFSVSPCLCGEAFFSFP